MKLAHHLHAPAQLIAAAQWQLPALLIVRHPADAVSSFVQREPHVSLRQALRNWLRFHLQVLPYTDNFVVATFDMVTSDFGRVIQRINARYGTTFIEFEHNSDNVADCFRAIEERNARRFGRGLVLEAGVARPSATRKAAKADVLQQLQAHPLANRLAAAEDLYRDLAAKANQPDSPNSISHHQDPAANA